MGGSGLQGKVMRCDGVLTALHRAADARLGSAACTSSRTIVDRKTRHPVSILFSSNRQRLGPPTRRRLLS
jgi:hypothetical protein